MGKFNWPELRALVTSIVESLGEDPPAGMRVWGDGWVSLSAVHNTLLGSWGPQVDEAELDILVDELVDGCALERTRGRLPLAGGGTWTVTLLRPMRKPRTEPAAAEGPPG